MKRRELIKKRAKQIRDKLAEQTDVFSELKRINQPYREKIIKMQAA